MERNWELKPRSLKYDNLNVAVNLGQLLALTFSTTLESQCPRLPQPTSFACITTFTQRYRNTAPQLLQTTLSQAFLRVPLWSCPHVQTIGFIHLLLVGTLPREGLDKRMWDVKWTPFSPPDLLGSPHPSSPTPIRDLSKMGSLQVSYLSTCAQILSCVGFSQKQDLR